MTKLILSIDQGTSGSKALIFSEDSTLLAEGRVAVTSSYPQEGFVEQDPVEIYTSVVQAVQLAVANLKAKGVSPGAISCCGISNQRETFVLWDKHGKPLTQAIIWQCKRSVSLCNDLIAAGKSEVIRNKTGLLIDPYFSGTKVLWLLENDPKVRAAIQKGDAYFGTVDTWLLYKLTKGGSYKTDYTNASRTLFFHLKDLRWDSELLTMYGLDTLQLPEIVPSAADFGTSTFEGAFAKPLAITAMIGDSHSAAFGERCFTQGSAKATLGTGSSMLMNTGAYVDPADTSMASTICWSTDTTVAYGLEGILVSCGSTITWLSDQLELMKSGKEADLMAAEVPNTGGVFLIPAFSGMGAPWWQMNRKGEIRGLTFDSDKRHVVRAGLESVAYQITDLLRAMEKESGKPPKSLRVNGGLTNSGFVMQYLASLNPKTALIKGSQKEASALGAAFMAGLGANIYNSIDDLQNLPYNDKHITAEADRSNEAYYQEWVSILSGG